MSGVANKTALYRESLNQGLAEKVASLDTDHYPESLIEIMEAALIDQTSSRGLPLLAAAINDDSVDADEAPQAAEILWQGMLMTALIAAEGKQPADGLIAGLAESYDEAHLLLAADTLLTWPFEYVSADETSALAVTIRQVLAGLAGAKSNLRGLLAWNPLERMLESLCPGIELHSINGVQKLCRWTLAAELRRWLGSSHWLDKAFAEADRRVRRTKLTGRLGEVKALLLG